MSKNWFMVLSLLFATSCTQPPAPIAMKGNQSFSNKSGGYGSSSKYQSNNGYNPSYTSPVPEQTEQKVSVDSIGISDLSPPDKANKKSNEIKSSDTDQKQDVNPWTNKPRSENQIKENEQGADKIKSPDNNLALNEKKEEEKKASDVYAPKDKKSVGMKWPVNSKKVVSSFGDKGQGKANDGIYIAAGEGDPVYAVADGEIVYVNAVKDYGNTILIKHSNGKTSTYSHLAKTVVEKYQRVKQGETIGYVGTSGNIKNPQLFFSLHKGKEAIDPQKYLSKDVANL